jgi:hypothetical protein
MGNFSYLGEQVRLAEQRERAEEEMENVDLGEPKITVLEFVTSTSSSCESEESAGKNLPRFPYSIDGS